jgi:cystathionine gamma-synthase
MGPLKIHFIMIGQELCDQPLWEAGDLGKAIPDSRHAISMALPTWRDVIGYEEKDPRVIDAIESGYPRFLIHPDVRRLARTVVPERPRPPPTHPEKQRMNALNL